jgi:hypothetical protein
LILANYSVRTSKGAKARLAARPEHRSTFFFIFRHGAALDMIRISETMC